jgi:hypothetical protein
MQQVAFRPNQNLNGNSKNSQTQKIVITAITLFALSGLMMGFAVGAFTRPQKQAPVKQAVVHTTVAKQPTPKPTTAQVVDVAAVGIACPIITPSSYAQNADGNTDYTVKAEIQDQTTSKNSPIPGCGSGKDLHAAGLMCKIWVTRNIDSLRNLAKSGDLSPVTNLQNAFPKEETDAFQFDNNQQSVQPCSQTGQTTWSYKLSPNLQPGNYFLAVVADWQGTVFNWGWQGIAIHSQNNN